MITPFRRSLIVLLALLFGLAIAVVSVMPIDRLAVGTRARYAAPADVAHHAAIMHAAVHVVIFGFAAAVAWFAADFAAKGKVYKVIAMLVTILLGCGTEYLQHRMYHNPLELGDIRLNVLSILAVFSVLAIITQVQDLKGANDASR